LALQMQDLKAPQFGKSECAEEKRSTYSADNQSTVDDSDEEWMALASVSSSLSTMTEESANMVLSSTSAARKTQVEDLQAENALLTKLLNEAREEITSLHQKHRIMEQVIQDNVCLQRKHQEMKGSMMLLIDEIDDLKNQLSKECQRCVDAEEQRWAQKELFHRMFAQVKHDMDKGNGQQASVFMNDKGAPLGEHLSSDAEEHVYLVNKRNASTSELFAEDKFKDATATHRMKNSFGFPLAESLHYLDA